jgi:hypothetical protein
MSNIKGIFQVKFITDLKHERELYIHLKDTLENYITKTTSFSYSLYGDCRNQPIITINLNGYIDDITNLVSKIEESIQENNIPLKRVKIQCPIDNENVPIECDGEHYFEAMLKVNIKEKNDWNNMVNLITPFGAHLLCVSDDTKYIELEDEPKDEKDSIFMLRNSDSDSGIFSKPFVILRTYTSLYDLNDLIEKMLNVLDENKFEYEKIFKVYNVYDSDVFLDHNWIFTDVPKNFITHVRPEMLLT